MVILCGPGAGEPDERGLLQGREQVRHLVRITRELAELEGELPRLFVVTRQAQIVRSHDSEEHVNLEQAGLRGLLRVIGSEHPLLRTTQIDVDEHTEAEQVAQQLLGGSEEDETAWRNGEWYAARLCPGPLSHDERQTAIVDHERDNMRLQIRTPGDLQTLESPRVTAFRPAPGRSRSRSPCPASTSPMFSSRSANTPARSDRLPQLGTDFAGVVTAVGPDVTDHQVGDRVGGLSPHGCWRTFVICEAQLAAKLSAGLTDSQAAAVPPRTPPPGMASMTWPGSRPVTRC